MKDKYIIIEWPEVQELMDKEGFESNAHPVTTEEFLTNFGGSSYFVNESWLHELESNLGSL